MCVYVCVCIYICDACPLSPPLPIRIIESYLVPLKPDMHLSVDDEEFFSPWAFCCLPLLT